MLNPIKYIQNLEHKRLLKDEWNGKIQQTVKKDTCMLKMTHFDTANKFY